MEEFSVGAVSGGSDAQGRALIRATVGEDVYQGTGVSTDIVEASAEALVNIMNRHHQRSSSEEAAEPVAQAG